MKILERISLFRSRRLQFDIIIVFVLVFLSTCVTIISYTYAQQTRAIIKLSKDLIQQSETTVINDINNYLKPAAITSITSYMLRRDTLSFQNQTRLISYMEDILKSYPQVVSIYIADTKGDYIEESRTIRTRPCADGKPCEIPTGSATITRIIKHSDDKPSEVWMYKDNENKVLKTYSFDTDLLNPLVRPWYQGALKSKTEYWMGVYPFFYTRSPGITVSFPSRDPEGKITGVVAMDFSLEDIKFFLEKQRVGKDGLIVITDHQGNVISFPGLPYSIKKLKSGKTRLLKIDELNAISLRLAYQHYKKNRQNYFLLQVGNEKFVAAFSPFSAGFNETWLLGLVTPIDNFVHPILKSNEIVLLISIGIMLIGIMLIILVSRQVSKDIVLLSHEADNIREFKLDQEIKLNTNIKEVQILLTALRSLKSSIKSFGKYVSTDLVRKLFASGEVAELSAHKKTLTVMFSDIVSFTRIAEAIPEEQLVQMLSEYLSIFSEEINEYRGTLDKYIGDAVMAFWGAPIDDSDHIMNACLATLRCEYKVNALNAKWRAEGYPEFRTRYGINTGTMIVGNMGSSNRLNYTVVGDNVNLAARLQSINKVYGTNIIVSEAVYEIVAERLLCRPIDYVRVKGKLHEVMLYELLGDRLGEHVPTNEQIELCELTTRAYHAYVKEDYELALSLYEEIAAGYPQDEVAQLYIKRCRTLLGL